MIEKKTKNRGGAPRGNQNARKHGYYSLTLTPRQRQALPTAASLTGLDLEIAIARLKLQSIIENGSLDAPVALRALSALSRMIRTKELIRTAHKAPGKSSSSRAAKQLTPSKLNPA